ncbi:Subtilisin-like protease [Vigna angularis]|uniref:Subtilisin-like protease n=1 Tax=Phaseolus angularis TaxID=3914 RepID=A0A8T0L9R5_PHAAN|nr:Subtilisin-like protease [Vigna angularis]
MNHKHVFGGKTSFAIHREEIHLFNYVCYVTLGDKKIIKGGSLSEYGLSSDKAYPLISSADAKYFNGSISEALNCQDGCLDPEKVKGKILVCFGDRLESNGEAIREGAVGLLLLNERNAGNEVLPQPYLLPAANPDITAPGFNIIAAYTEAVSATVYSRGLLDKV